MYQTISKIQANNKKCKQNNKYKKQYQQIIINPSHMFNNNKQTILEHINK